MGRTRLLGWTGTIYARLCVLWGYLDRYAEYEESLNVLVGDRSVTFSTVPAGEVWVVTSFAAWSAQTDVDTIYLKAHCDGADLVLAARGYTTEFRSIELPNSIILKEDDYLWALFEGCSLNNDIYASANGYKMSVAE